MISDDAIFRILVDGTHEAMFIISEKGNIEYLNHAAEKTFGLSFVEVVEKPIEIIADDSSKDKLKNIFSENKEKKLEINLEKKIEVMGVFGDKKTFPMRFSISQVFIDDSESVYLGMSHDLTNEKKSEANKKALFNKLAESKKHLDSIVNSIDGVVWEKDMLKEDNPFTYVSNFSSELYGYKKEDIIDDPFLIDNNTSHSDVIVLNKSLKDITQDSKNIYIDIKYFHPEKNIIYIKNIVTPIWHKDKLIKIRGVSTDITEQINQIKTQDKLIKSVNESEEKIRSLVNSLEGMVWEKKAQDEEEYTFVSDRIKDIFKIEPSVLYKNKNWFLDRIQEDDIKEYKSKIKNLKMDDKNIQIEYRLYKDDKKNDYIYVRDIITPIWKNNEIAKYQGVIFDVSKYKKISIENNKIEKQLRQSQKLEAVGQLSAGIAHEINTPTQFVSDNIHYLKKSFEQISDLLKQYDILIASAKAGEDIENHIQDIITCKDNYDIDFLLEDIPNAIDQSLEGTARISKIVTAMKEFSHPGSDSKESFDINNAIENTVTVAINEWRYVAEVELNLNKDIPLITGYPGEINQTILNIIVNAAHSIAEKESDGEGNKGEINISTELNDEWLDIKIRDSGKGMSKELISRIFDPFFTTKEVGRGTGQGLSLAHTVIVEKHAGKINVNSTLGEGTEFIISLPLLSES